MHTHQQDIELQPPDEEDLDPVEFTDEELGFIYDGLPWMPEPEPFEDFLDTEAKVREIVKIPDILPSQFTEFAFRMPKIDGMGYENFSFEGRRHMIRPYNTPAKRILLFCGRQVEKTVAVCTQISMADGSLRDAGSIVVGDRVCTLKDANDVDMTTGEVMWVSRRYTKPCVRIRTRQGHECVVALTHPMRLWGVWREAGELRVGDRLAAVRQCGNFLNKDQPRERIRLTAYMIGDGHADGTLGFTCVPGPTLDEFLQDVTATQGTYRLRSTPGKGMQVHLHAGGMLRGWLKADGLYGTRSATKFVPDWVFDLSKEDTALFLNRLWSTDGHVKQNGVSKYSIEYCSISRRLIRQVQALLWKFGVPSKIRENWPSIYKRRGEKKLAYILRVETQEGVRRFISEIGALGKSELVEAPTSAGNNNRDTYPIEINDLVRSIIVSNPRPRSGRRAKEGSLRSAGLRETFKYPPTADKLASYLDFFASDTAYDWSLVERLARHLETDLYWDEVVSIEDAGEQECVDFEVKDHHNFVADGFVTHNSTLLGNIILTYSCVVPAYKTLYVSPSATQTKTFSSDRIKEPIETSPVLKTYTTNALLMNILEKQFVNRAKITMRYAFLNADRTRGIPAWLLALDELQDIMADNVPVIEQCTSHAPERFKRFIYSGTPKGLDNPIEYYRSGVSKDGKPMSTQGEWVVPCDRHGGDTGMHWNVLAERNIGRKGLICEKCGELINPMHEKAQWANMIADGIFESYRIPQLMVPWRPWDEILLDYGRYARDKFYNEVLGISYDSGLRPLTSGQIKDCCNPEITMHPDAIEKLRKKLLQGRNVFAGLDHGTGENSYSVLSLGCYEEMKFRIFWIHRFTGEDVDPQIQTAKVISILRAFNVKILGSDYGGGFDRNNVLVREFGPARVHKFQYQARVRKKVYRDDRLQRWMVHRTEVMSDVFSAIKRKQIEFPRWEEFQQPYAQDMLNIFSEYNETLRMIVYKHRPDRPDDAFHSILYCFLASMILHPRPDIIAPKREFGNVGPVLNNWSGPVWQG